MSSDAPASSDQQVQSTQDAEIRQCESPEPPDMPKSNRPKPPFRRPDSRDGSQVIESPDDYLQNLAYRRVSAGESAGQPAESEPSTPNGEQGRLHDAAVLRHIDALFEQTIATLRVDDLVEQRVAARGIEDLVEQRVTAAGIDKLVEERVAAARVEKLVEEQVAKAKIEGMVEEHIKNVAIDQLVQEKVAKSGIEQLVEQRVAKASIESLVEKRVNAAEIDKLVEGRVGAANIEKLVEGQVTAAGIEQLVDGRVNAAQVEKLVERHIESAGINKLVEERVAACGIDKLVEEHMAKGGIEKLVEQQVQASNIEKIVEGRVAASGIDKLVEQQVASSSIEKLVESRVASSGIEKLVEQQVSASGIDKLVEQQVASRGIEKLVESRVASSGIDKLVEQQVSASGIDKLVEQKVSASGIDKLVEGRVAASGIDKLVEKQVSDRGVEKLVEQSVASRGIERLVEQSIRERDIDKLITDGIAAKGIEGLVENKMDSVVKRHLSTQESAAAEQIEKLTEKKMDSVVSRHMGGVEKQVDTLVEQRMEQVVARRLASQDVDAMIVASVATRDVMKGAEDTRKEEEKRKSQMEEIQVMVASQLDAKETDVERRVSDRLSERLSRQLEEQIASMPPAFTPVSISRPPTSPRPFSSEHRSRSQTQNKAGWTSRALYTVAAVPNEDSTRGLHHADLEAELTDKVLAVQPDRSALGFNEIVMRDIANSMVRELVGIFESLLDRLLIEKKQDTLRTMVAELVTEDTLKMVATGRDQLLRKEIGHISREIERLGMEVRDKDATWEQRFQITQELRESQDDLYTWVDERCRDIEARLQHLEQNYMTREEIGRLFKQHAEALEQVKKQGLTTEEQRKVLHQSFIDYQKHCKDTFATQTNLSDQWDALDRQITQNKSKTDKSIQDIRLLYERKDEVEVLKQEINMHLSMLDKAKFDMSNDISRLETVFQKTNRSNDEIFATKREMNKGFDDLDGELHSSVDNLRRSIIAMESAKATKEQVSQNFTYLEDEVKRTNGLLGKTTTSVDRNTGLLMALETKVDSNFATRHYVDETTKTVMEEAVERSNCKEELGRLWKDFEAERERLRQTVRQQQSTRKDLNDAVEDIQNLRLGSNGLEKRCDELHSYTASVDAREVTHRHQTTEALRSQKQSHEDLQVFHTALRQELMSHKDYQKVESERLEQRSTYRYLEQIDKALNLTQSVERVSKDQEGLNQTVRGIKLPTVL